MIAVSRWRVGNTITLRFVRASVAVLRKSSSVWHAVTVSHRRAHRQRCTRKANQRTADIQLAPTTINLVTTMT
eukprot:491420-Prymnesium_polylepis.1